MKFTRVGIVGGGQLGRMLALAGYPLGLRCLFLDRGPDTPGAQVAPTLVGELEDPALLQELASQSDVVTFDWENISGAALAPLEKLAAIRPPRQALEISQDRLHEKALFSRLKIPVAAHAAVDSPDDLRRAARKLGIPGILKTRRMGYDGKGQARIGPGDDPAAAWAGIGERPAIVEALVAFDGEFSVILARGVDGATIVYDVPHNRHEGGILDVSAVPAPDFIACHSAAAVALSRKVAEALDYVGVLTIEFFATPQGPVFNEMASRVHNSGHWTIEGARVSQFENHIRAVCGLPLGPATLTAPKVRMQNLLGDAVHDWAAVLADPGAHLHLYGKSEVKPGRKMGHVTWL